MGSVPHPRSDVVYAVGAWGIGGDARDDAYDKTQDSPQKIYDRFAHYNRTSVCFGDNFIDYTLSFC